jgi:hypothetical protein
VQAPVVSQQLTFDVATCEEHGHPVVVTNDPVLVDPGEHRSPRVRRTVHRSSRTVHDDPR